MVTLHHFTHPMWFESLGGFENEANVAIFVDFAKKMFAEFGQKVQLWCTLNEPEVFTANGWQSAIFPPGKNNPKLSGIVLRNLVKDIFQFHPWNKWNPLDLVLSKILDQVFNKSILKFFETGVFEFNFPGASLRYEDRSAPTMLDFIGLNYYSHYYAQITPGHMSPFTLRSNPADVMTDMPYAMYPEGFYSALKSVGRLKKPVYVTETGVADARDDIRALFIRRYLYAMKRAIDEGVQVKGFFYWTLVDNFEWAEGYMMKFGLFAMDDKFNRIPRDGSKVLKDVIAASTAAQL
jgi:beta-glucosidase